MSRPTFPGSVHHFIYAVAKNPEGQYLFHPESEIYRRQFASALARQTYWEVLIRKPEISIFGDAFEISLVDETPNQSRWRVVKTVYANLPLIRATRSDKRGELVDCTPAAEFAAIAQALRHG